MVRISLLVVEGIRLRLWLRTRDVRWPRQPNGSRASLPAARYPIVVLRAALNGQFKNTSFDFSTPTQGIAACFDSCVQIRQDGLASCCQYRRLLQSLLSCTLGLVDLIGYFLLHCQQKTTVDSIQSKGKSQVLAIPGSQ